MSTTSSKDGKTRRRSIKTEAAQPGPSRTLDENVEAIKRWEQELLHAREIPSGTARRPDHMRRGQRSGAARSCRVVRLLDRTPAITGFVPGVSTFDPFPFPFLTMTVSLEAIFLALFAIASQDRLARQASASATAAWCAASIRAATSGGARAHSAETDLTGEKVRS